MLHLARSIVRYIENEKKEQSSKKRKRNTNTKNNKTDRRRSSQLNKRNVSGIVGIIDYSIDMIRSKVFHICSVIISQVQFK